MKIKKETSIECTLNLHKRTYGVKFQNRAYRSVLEIRKFVQKIMITDNIRIDTELNKEIWKNGRRHVPSRLRIQLVK